MLPARDEDRVSQLLTLFLLRGILERTVFGFRFISTRLHHFRNLACHTLKHGSL